MSIINNDENKLHHIDKFYKKVMGYGLINDPELSQIQYHINEFEKYLTSDKNSITDTRDNEDIRFSDKFIDMLLDIEFLHSNESKLTF